MAASEVIHGMGPEKLLENVTGSRSLIGSRGTFFCLCQESQESCRFLFLQKLRELVLRRLLYAVIMI